MFDGLWKSKFYTKCKSDIKLTRTRIEMIKKKRNAMQKYLRNDVADLLKNGLDTNAYNRVEGLLVEINRSECYEFIDRCCALTSNHLTSMDKQRECPEECRESISSLMFAAARIADLPELRELRNVFSEKYGNSFDCFANKELAEKLKCGVPSRDKKLQLLQEIAAESGLEWNSKALENKLFNEQANEKDFAKETIDHKLKLNKERIASEKEKDSTAYKQREVTKVEDKIQQKKDHEIPRVKDIQVDTITSIRNQDQQSLARNQPKEEHEEDTRKYGLIAPPYSKSEPEKTDKMPEEEKAKPVPKSVRRRHSNNKFPPVRDASNEIDRSEKSNAANKEQAAQAQRVLRFLDKGNNSSNMDEEEQAMDKLLRHYSRKKGTHERARSDLVPETPFKKNDVSKTGSKKETNGKEGPSRLFSLPRESSGPREASTRHVRASSFQPEMLSGNHKHVHPKLPDYDDFVATLAELRKKRIN